MTDPGFLLVVSRRQTTDEEGLHRYFLVGEVTSDGPLPLREEGGVVLAGKDISRLVRLAEATPQYDVGPFRKLFGDIDRVLPEAALGAPLRPDIPTPQKTPNELASALGILDMAKEMGADDWLPRLENYRLTPSERTVLLGRVLSHFGLPKAQEAMVHLVGAQGLPDTYLVHRHYKDGLYTPIGVARDEDDPEGPGLIVYKVSATSTLSVRGLEEWNKVVTWPDGERLPRFVPFMFSPRGS